MQCRPLFPNNRFAIHVKQLRERYSLTQEAPQLFMDHAAHNKIVSFIWGIADDVLRDLFVRGKYRDVILPMFVLRRLDAVLEPTQKLVLETNERDA